MTFDLLLRLLRAHLVALQSSDWPLPQGPSNGPAFYLDVTDTRALIAELTRIQRELAVRPAGPSTSAAPAPPASPSAGGA